MQPKKVEARKAVAPAPDLGIGKLDKPLLPRPTTESNGETARTH